MPELKIKFKLNDEVYLAYEYDRFGNSGLLEWVYGGPFKVCEIRLDEYGLTYAVEGAIWVHNRKAPRFQGKQLFKTEAGARRATVRFHNDGLKCQMR